MRDLCAPYASHEVLNIRFEARRHCTTSYVMFDFHYPYHLEHLRRGIVETHTAAVFNKHGKDRNIAITATRHTPIPTRQVQPHPMFRRLGEAT